MFPTLFLAECRSVATTISTTGTYRNFWFFEMLEVTPRSQIDSFFGGKAGKPIRRKMSENRGKYLCLCNTALWLVNEILRNLDINNYVFSAESKYSYCIFKILNAYFHIIYECLIRKICLREGKIITGSRSTKFTVFEEKKSESLKYISFYFFLF